MTSKTNAFSIVMLSHQPQWPYWGLLSLPQSTHPRPHPQARCSNRFGPPPSYCAWGLCEHFKMLKQLAVRWQTIFLSNVMIKGWAPDNGVLGQVCRVQLRCYASDLWNIKCKENLKVAVHSPPLHSQGRCSPRNLGSYQSYNQNQLI